ncbi:tyrosine-type recombinase/integrase [Streptomyces sp. NPDC020747]|uniref:tyrosine-type recombinase/integrase n=1 Tax=Streptomyces sp. NPDC020747 TaxID=3365086 RepID=UPI003797FCC7
MTASQRLSRNATRPAICSANVSQATHLLNRTQAHPHTASAATRHIFATDLVNNGVPIHIGAALLGHLSLQTTRGYVAVFDEDVTRHYQQFLDNAGICGLRPNTDPPRPTSGPHSRTTSTPARSNSTPAAAPTPF